MGRILDQRRVSTEMRIQDLKGHLTKAEQLCGDKACVYMTGSFARGEAHEWSDLDLFIVGRSTNAKRDLPRLAEICIKAELIDAIAREKIQPFSKDGQYLEHYTLHDLRDTLGKPEDDVSNTFTARLLLLLESKPLLGGEVYQDIIQEIVSKYWLEYVDHRDDFMPAFLANDILRLWRTFCVNYEARTSKQPELENAKRKLKNYKLKYSRLLTCYSALIYLLGVHTQKKTVSPQDATNMISLTPTQRLEWVTSQRGLPAAHEGIATLISAYEVFLSNTDRKEEQLVDQFSDRALSRRYFAEAAEFGNQIFQVLTAIGQDQPLFRLLVV